ncbi:MAG: hypothetical protein KC994_08205, partial [Candidatus Omnitrophica bacterium]|nr:hypothetical protein [Candidatus Omnitrophota bacterium]
VHFVPGILEVGDLSQIARGISPRPLLIAAPRNGDGSISPADKWKGGNLRFVPDISPSQALDDLPRLKSNP